MGKTELALEFAHRFASDYDVAWWIPAELPTSATAALAALAGRLEVAQVADQTAMVAGLFDLLRQRDRWLLVYDNAERPERLAGLLPPGGGGQVLVTSRWSAWGSQATPLRVNVLRREESVAFLASGSGDQAALDALAELLSDLPLALEEAAAYLEETGEGLGEHLELVRGRARELFGLDTVWLRRLYSLFFIELDTDGSTWLGRPAIPTPPGHPASAQPAAGLGAARTPGTLWTLADEDQRGRCRGEIGLAGSCMSTGELHERICAPCGLQTPAPLIRALEMRSRLRPRPMEPGLLGSNVDSVAPTGAKETEMHDWKLSPLPIVMLHGWAHHEPQHRRETPQATRPWRSLVGRGVATIRRLLANEWTAGVR